MRYLLVILAICTAASQAAAECPAQETIEVFGQTVDKGGLAGAFRDGKRDCDVHDQPAWLAKMNEGAPAKGPVPRGLTYCRQIAQSKEPQTEAQRRDCVFWYGHSIEVR